MTVVDLPPAVPAEIEAAIKHRCGWQIRDLQVEVRNQFIVLRGWASTYYAKQLAQHTAMALIGLAALQNRIVVRRKPGEGRPRFNRSRLLLDGEAGTFGTRRSSSLHQAQPAAES
jgi:hypothetical protein